MSSLNFLLSSHEAVGESKGVVVQRVELAHQQLDRGKVLQDLVGRFERGEHEVALGVVLRVVHVTHGTQVQHVEVEQVVVQGVEVRGREDVHVETEHCLADLGN